MIVTHITSNYRAFPTIFIHLKCQNQIPRLILHKKSEICKVLRQQISQYIFLLKILLKAMAKLHTNLLEKFYKLQLSCAVTLFFKSKPLSIAFSIGQEFYLGLNNSNTKYRIYKFNRYKQEWNHLSGDYK